LSQQQICELKSNMLADQLAVMQEVAAKEAKATVQVSELAADLSHQRQAIQAASTENEELLRASVLTNRTLEERLKELESTRQNSVSAVGPSTHMSTNVWEHEDPRETTTRGVRIGGGFQILRSSLKDQGQDAPLRSRVHNPPPDNSLAQIAGGTKLASAPPEHEAHSYAHGAPARATSAERFRIGAQVGDRCFSQKVAPMLQAKAVLELKGGGGLGGRKDESKLFRVLTQANIRRCDSAPQMKAAATMAGPLASTLKTNRPARVALTLPEEAETPEPMAEEQC